MVKYSVLLLITLFLISCEQEGTDNEDITDDQESDTITLSPEEIFSSTLVEDILQTGNDEDLKFYLEEEIYPLVSNSNKVTLDRISASLYLLTYEDNGDDKNFIIQKFYSPVNFEVFFKKRETETNAINQYFK
jgi:PBP1b-binding outer membrane lipoprotein LpoB